MKRDPGLQPERTRLAWRRTMLSMTIVVALIVRLALLHGPVGYLAAAVALVGWGAAMAVAYRRATRLTAPKPPGIARAVPATAVATVGYAALGLLLGLLTLR